MSGKGPLKLLHVLSLSGAGGVECSLERYVLETASRQDMENHVVVTGEPIAERFRDTIQKHAKGIYHKKFWRGVKLPKLPAALRKRHIAAIASGVSPHVVIFYNGLGDLSNLAFAPAGARLIYYERGSAWRPHPAGDVEKFLSRIDTILCNSHASKRVLELKWGLKEGAARVCHIGVRLEEKCEPRPRSIREKKTIHLGMAGRLDGLKGACLAIHALKELKDSPQDFVLHIAGKGPEQGRLQQLSKKLGVADKVHFHGFVNDMAAFYEQIDVFLCPSVRESLGNVCIEAGYYGLPVVASAVDGLPEIVQDGKTGFCIRPSLPIEDYEALGGSITGLPGWVYDPVEDRLSKPRLAAPQSIAKKIGTLCANPDRYENMSAKARRFVTETFNFSRYLARFNGLVLGTDLEANAK